MVESAVGSSSREKKGERQGKEGKRGGRTFPSHLVLVPSIRVSTSGSRPKKTQKEEEDGGGEKGGKGRGVARRRVNARGPTQSSTIESNRDISPYHDHEMKVLCKEEEGTKGKETSRPEF